MFRSQHCQMLRTWGWTLPGETTRSAIWSHLDNNLQRTRRRMARERRGAESSVVSMEIHFLHTGSFTHRRFYTQTIYTQTLFTRRRFYTQKLLHRDAFTHRPFYTQTLLHTDAFTHRDAFYTQALLHTDAFTHRGFLNTGTFTQTRTAQVKSQFYLSFCRSTLISCERVARGQVKSQFYLSFCRSTFISCERVARGQVKSQFYYILPQFLPIDPHSCERVARGQVKSQFYLSFCRSTLISCERVARGQVKSQFYFSLL